MSGRNARSWMNLASPAFDERELAGPRDRQNRWRTISRLMGRDFLRILAATLLALAVPLQGMASVAAGQCMAFGHHQDADDQDQGHHGHELGAGGHDHPAEKHADEGKSSHCGPCAACCASASMAAPAAPSILSSPSLVDYLFVQLEPPGVELQRFDRPPLAL